MKIGVVGCGALGSYYGGLLCRAGHETHFLLRSDFETVQHKGVHVESPNGDFHFKPHAHDHPEDIGQCDLVLIGLKTTANDVFPALLPPLVGPDTTLLTLQNGLGNEESLRALFPDTHLVGGLCFVCLNRTAPGRIRHMDHGLIVMGEYEGSFRPFTMKLEECFKQAGIPCKLTENLSQAHWEKLMWNIPFNGLGVAGSLGHAAFEIQPDGLRSLSGCDCLDANALLGDANWEARVRGLMREVRSAALKLGHFIEADFESKLIERTRTMGPYKASTIIDYEKGLPLEINSLFEEPLKQAKAANAETPILERLTLILRELQYRQDASTQT